MFVVYLSVLLVGVLANSQTTMQTFGGQINSTYDQINHLTSNDTDILNDCLLLENRSTLNCSLFKFDGDTENNTHMLDEELPAWRVTFTKVQFFLSGIYMQIVVVVTVIGEAITLSALRKDILPPSSTIYLTGLSVADLIFVISCFPISFRGYPNIWNSRPFQSFNAIRFCYFNPLIRISQGAAVWVTIFFTIERFIAVTWPLKAQRVCTKGRARLAVMVAFGIGTILNVLGFFRRYVIRKVDPVTQEAYLSYAFTDLGRHKTVAGFLFWSHLVLMEAVPFAVLICFNSAIIWRVWRARQNRLLIDAGVKDSCDTGKARESQITRVLICIVVGFLVCNTCTAYTTVLLAVKGTAWVQSTEEAYVYYLYAVGNALYVTNPLVNCLLYVICSSAVRNGIKSQLCFWRNQKNKPKESDTSTNVTSEPEV